jgi:hypothetical protein
MHSPITTSLEGCLAELGSGMGEVAKHYIGVGMWPLLTSESQVDDRRVPPSETT